MTGRILPDQTKYYALLLAGETPAGPSGLARRIVRDNGGLRDEAVTRDLSWARTPLIAAAERGDMTFELVEITAEEAERVIEGFRVKWGSGG
jgi:hypothetical protein